MRGKSQTYRTMCVRLCDGYYFPISYSTTSDRFEADERACKRSCPSGAKLYAYRNPGQEPEEMVDIDGRPYTKLPTAFSFRTKLDQACKCAPHPWEQEAMDLHRRYAEDAARTKTQRRTQLDAKTGKSTKARGAQEKVADAGGSTKRDDGNVASATAMPLGFVPTGGHVGLLNASSSKRTTVVTAAEKPAKPVRTAAKPQPESRATAAAKVANHIPPPSMRLGAAMRTASIAPRPPEAWRNKVFANAH